MWREDGDAYFVEINPFSDVDWLVQASLYPLLCGESTHPYNKAMFRLVMSEKAFWARISRANVEW
jgi:hypothetical protein